MKQTRRRTTILANISNRSSDSGLDSGSQPADDPKTSQGSGREDSENVQTDDQIWSFDSAQSSHSGADVERTTERQRDRVSNVVLTSLHSG